MKCLEVGQSICAYLDRELPESAARAVESHLRECEKCRKDFGPLVTFLSVRLPVPVPEGLRDRIVDEVEGTMGWRRNWRRWAFRVCAAAAGVVLVVLVGRMAPVGDPNAMKKSPVGVVLREGASVVPSPWLVSSSVQSVALSGWSNPVGVVVQAMVMENVTRRIIEGSQRVAQVRYRTRVTTPAQYIPQMDLAIFSVLNRL